jgi:hypothetical protein
MQRMVKLMAWLEGKQGKEYEFGLHNVPSPEEAGKVSLRNAKLDCKLELRMLLEGFEHVLQEVRVIVCQSPFFVLFCFFFWTPHAGLCLMRTISFSHLLPSAVTQ